MEKKRVREQVFLPSTNKNVKYLKSLFLVILSLILCQCGAMQEKYNSEFPMHKAAADGDLASIKGYLSKGMSVNYRDRYGNTPLHSAAYKGQNNVVLYLMKNGANLTAKQQDGYTPSGGAKLHKHYTTMNLILAKGGNAEYDMSHKQQTKEAENEKFQRSLENLGRVWGR